MGARILLHRCHPYHDCRRCPSERRLNPPIRAS
jgi:hypothetical protein